MRIILVVLAALFAMPAAHAARHHHHVAVATTFHWPWETKNVRRASTHRHHVAYRHVRRAAPALPSTDTSLIAAARSQIGNGAIYGRATLWCATFMNWVLERGGYQGTHSDLAKSFAALPHTNLHVGAIAVMHRRGGGHVGIVSGVTAAGDPILISGNNGHRVREAAYPLKRVVVFVEPR